MKITQTILLPLLLVVLAGAGLYGFIFHKVKIITEETERLEAEIELEQVKAQNRISVRKILEDTEVSRTSLNSRVLTTSDVVSFLETLESLAERAGGVLEIGRITEGVTLDSVMSEGEESKPVPHPASSLVEWIQFDIMLEGGWDAVYTFLEAIDSLPYIAELSNIRLEVKDVPQEENAPRSDDWKLMFILKVSMFKK